MVLILRRAARGRGDHAPPRWRSSTRCSHSWRTRWRRAGPTSSPPSRISSRSPDERFTSAATRSFRADAAPVLTGRGLNAIRKTNRCNRAVSNSAIITASWTVQPPIGEGMWEIGGSEILRATTSTCCCRIHDEAHAASSYVYLEPFMEIEKYYGIIHKPSAARACISICTPTAHWPPRKTCARWARRGWTSCASISAQATARIK